MEGREYWAEALAKEVLDKNPKLPIYTCAAGISPSGTVHFGNFRDVATTFAVFSYLKKNGAKAQCIFSWDNFDRFRKVPVNVDESFQKYIGMPLTSVPSPVEGYDSYADFFQEPFVAAMKELKIEIEYKNQTEEYKSGRYDEKIFLALGKRRDIAEILLSFMTEKGKETANLNEEEYINNYFPISVYSNFTGKDSTKVLGYDGDKKITYLCLETNKKETVDLSKTRIAKLYWKIDWAMRWQAEGVVFEPGGHDHASPGGSFDVAKTVSEKIFGYKPPVFAEYKFVGIQGLGTKMSGSKGNAISPKELLEIYEPALLKWLYFRKRPDQAFSLAFDSEIYRQYDEFDRAASEDPEDPSVELAETEKYKNPIPFKQAVALGQITQWSEEKVLDVSKNLKNNYDKKSITVRLPKAKNWLEKYNVQDEIKLREEINSEYAGKLSEKTIAQIKTLRAELKKESDSIENLETLVYSIPKEKGLTDKENAPNQKEFFKHLYMLLISRETGPRLSTFLWAVPRQKVLKLLDI